MRFLRPLFRLSDSVRQRARRGRMDPDQALGRDGEDIAHRLMQKRGMTVVARNWKTPSGWAEADLIAWDGGRLVFVEVKSRRSREFGAPDREISDEKRRKIAAAAREYCRNSSHAVEDVRFDVVSVVFEPERAVEYFAGAWSAAEVLR